MLAIIGGRGLTQLANLKITHQQVMRTPYGEPSGAFMFGTLDQHEVIFLARHGYGHTIPPHLVNYRANLWVLREHGASKVISVATVGGIRADLKPGVIVVPDQIIDFTHAATRPILMRATSRSAIPILPFPIAPHCAATSCAAQKPRDRR